MARIARSLFVLAFPLTLALAGCAAGPKSTAAAKAPQAAPDTQFTNQDQKILACLDLQDHIVDLYASDYVSREGASMSTVERTAFRDGWAEELAKRGTFERFEQACFSGLTPGRYHCGMQSQTTDGLAACMRLSAR
jgi:hypothetical protein